jgi:hypothetical protein
MFMVEVTRSLPLPKSRRFRPFRHSAKAAHRVRENANGCRRLDSVDGLDERRVETSETRKPYVAALRDKKRHLTERRT